MISDPILKKSIHFARAGKYDQALKLLEAEVFRYQDSYLYYHVLGLCCLYAGDFGGAFTYLSRAKNIKFKEVPTLLGLAALFLRRGNTDRALDLYLDIQESDPKNKIAKRGLKIIRKYSGTDELQTWLIQGKLPYLYPALPRTKITIKPLPFIIAGIAAAIGLGIFIGIKNLPFNQREGLEQSMLEKAEAENPVEMGGVYRYILNADQVISVYNDARNYFNRFQDEAAKRELNRILESNASEAVKNKARLLLGYTQTPGFDTLKDRFSFSEVSADPLLYRDCYILWRGSAANLRTGPSMISFEFLVGYDTRTIMEGIVPVELNIPAEINTMLPLEVLGRIVPLGSDRFMIAGIGIHQSQALLE